MFRQSSIVLIQQYCCLLYTSNQEEFRESGTKGICIEARELIIALPESFVDYEPDKD